MATASFTSGVDQEPRGTPVPSTCSMRGSFVSAVVVHTLCFPTHGCGSKLTRRGYAGFGPCVHLPGQPILGYRFFEPQPHCFLS